MISIPLAAECGESHEGARACYDSVPDRHVTAANTGAALQLCEDRGYAGVRWPIRATLRPLDPARAADSTASEQRGFDPSGKDASAPRGYAVFYREFLHQKQADPKNLAQSGASAY
jgi:hypothetical protein